MELSLLIVWALLIAPAASLAPPLSGLRVAVVGAGPSGLLLSYRLLRAGASVRVLEGRKDPSLAEENLDGRAYALGIGIRGRTAIRSVDDGELWDAVKARGYESERFTLYLNGFPIRLRDGTDDASLEPSVLMYQSDLCAALLDELRRLPEKKNLQIDFEQNVESFGLDQKLLLEDNKASIGPFDLIVGCDGVNSRVRASMNDLNPTFEAETNPVPGEFKVVRLTKAPEKVDPTSVALILPKGGSTTAFVEPTASGSCILFAGNDENDPILRPTSNLTATSEALEERFPLLAGLSFDDIANQLSTQSVGRASSVECNLFHSNGFAVLVGDAAHATGGVSGQGVNSALVDSMVLADCLEECYGKEASMEAALLKYSQKQVPEGKALYDLSFGPNPKGLVKNLRFRLSGILDTFFQGRFGIGERPLQTLLTTSTIPFSDVRRARDEFYEEPFPSRESFDELILQRSKDM